MFINSATRTADDSLFVDNVDYIMNFFKEANPNAKFILLGNASYAYNKNSFVVSDGYHSNALAGYITTLTAYCAVTGEKAYLNY